MTTDLPRLKRCLSKPQDTGLLHPSAGAREEDRLRGSGRREVHDGRTQGAGHRNQLVPGRLVSGPERGRDSWEAGKGGAAFQTTDCKKDFEELKSRGVKFEESKPGEYPWGIHATFIDPDENRFILLLPAAKQVW